MSKCENMSPHPWNRYGEPSECDRTATKIMTRKSDSQKFKICGYCAKRFKKDQNFTITQLT